MSEISPAQKQIEEADQTREALRQAFEQFYLNLANFLQRLNMNPQVKTFCSMNFDQGAYWAREGIHAMFRTFQSPSQENQNDKPDNEGSEDKQEEKLQE